MRFVRPAALVALFATTAISVPAHAAPPTQAEKAQAATALIRLSQLNLITKEDLRFNGGGEVEGKIWIGRDALKTGGAQTTQVGFGASNGQSTAASAFNTVTVGRDANIGFQYKNSVGGTYGVHIGRDSTQEINTQDNGGTVKIGRDSSGGVKLTQGSTLNVVGNYTSQNGLDMSDNNTVWIGGNSTRIQGGNTGLSVKVGGNLDQLSLNAGSAQIGGSLTGGNSSIKGDLTVLGSVSNLSLNANNLTVKVGGSASNISLSNASHIYAGGSVSVQNLNGGTVHQNCGPTYAGAACAGHSAPTSPGVPTVASVQSQTDTMFTQFESLSKVLASLDTAGHLGTINTSNTQSYNFTSLATSGYTVFNVNETIFNRNEFAYSFANTTTPIIINVNNSGACALTKSCSYTMNSNFTGNAAQYNQNVIWNFADASSVVLNRQFQGTVLAALADLQANVIEGSVVAKNFTMTNEIHLGTFKRNDENSFALTGVVPEPSQWAMLIAGFGIVGGVVRRRRRSLVIAA